MDATTNKGGAAIFLPDDVLDALVEQVASLFASRVGQSSWMNVETAAAYLDVPPKRLYNLTASKEIPHRKQDGRILFHRDELDEWLDGHYEGPARLSRTARA
jgi:excisionase family DNA binding protein